MFLQISFLSLITCVFSTRRPVPEYEINLDLDPQDRFAALVPKFNSTVWKFFNTYFANDKILTTALYDLVDQRGFENPEMQAEIEGMSDVSGLPLKFVQGIQMLYELQTLMVPIENITQFPLPKEFEVFAHVPWRGPGCTGIIAMDKNDGTVYHARNLDFSPKDIMQDLAYTGIFKKNGKEVFRSQMIAGYSCIVTGMKMGKNGFTIERNTRYTDHVGGNEEMFDNLLKKKRPLNGWTLRKVLELATDYEEAVSSVASAQYVSTEYAIISGVKKGTILSKDPDGVAHTMTLGQPNFECRDDYIIITNFDYFFHDIREYFDPTGGQIGRPRRIVAQKALNASAVLTPEVLFSAIDMTGVIATDTIFQAIMNVETGLWNVSLPSLS